MLYSQQYLLLLQRVCPHRLPSRQLAATHAAWFVPAGLSVVDTAGLTLGGQILIVFLCMCGCTVGVSTVPVLLRKILLERELKAPPPDIDIERAKIEALALGKLLKFIPVRCLSCLSWLQS